MKCNVGKIDNVIRFVAGIAIGAAGLYFKSWWGLPGLVFFVTALIHWCPLYFPFRLSTCKK